MRDRTFIKQFIKKFIKPQKWLKWAVLGLLGLLLALAVPPAMAILEPATPQQVSPSYNPSTAASNPLAEG
ncbi:MAG: hypothetical protein WBF52_05285, partial [Geitlerinemataceae cyanobacterium]